MCGELRRRPSAVADLYAVFSSTPRDSVVRDKLHKHTLAMLPYTRLKDLYTIVIGHIIHNVLWPLSGYNTQSIYLQAHSIIIK